MSGAYYNEFEPVAAQWLRNLIAAGQIPDGEVDERDIRDVTPAELVRFTQCHFFAGIGIWPLALRRAGWPDDRPIWTGSCPCQPFSGAGAGGGFDDERHLWPHWFWLIQHVRPVAIAGEQVTGQDGSGWLDLVSDDLGGIGYAVGAADICAAGFGMGWRGSAEQKRVERALRDCPDPLVARHLGAFADWADSSLAIGGFHIRQRFYVVGLADEPEGGRGVERDAMEPGHGGHADRGRDASGGLADEHCDGRGEARSGRGPAGNDGPDRDGAAGRVADGAGSGGRSGLRDRGPTEQRGDVPADDGTNGGVGNADRARTPSGLSESAERQEGHPEKHDDRGHRLSGPDQGGPAANWLGDAGRDGNREHAGKLSGDEGEHEVGSPDRDHPPEHSGPAGGPVPDDGGRRDADWLFCRDGVWRPVRPGSFPLAHAAPARVGRLRAYGNGLDLETATAFAESVIEIGREQGRWK